MKKWMPIFAMLALGAGFALMMSAQQQHMNLNVSERAQHVLGN